MNSKLLHGSKLRFLWNNYNMLSSKKQEIDFDLDDCKKVWRQQINCTYGCNNIERYRGKVIWVIE